MKAKVVRFGEISERFIPDMNLTVEERESLWFTRKQLRWFRRRAEKDDSESASISSSRCSQRLNYIRYVLRIQAYNKSVEINDPTGLGAVAVALSKNAMESARFRAEKDAAASRKEAEQQQKDLFITNTETDDKRPGCQTRRSHVSISAPKRNRTAANMA